MHVGPPIPCPYRQCPSKQKNRLQTRRNLCIKHAPAGAWHRGCKQHVQSWGHGQGLWDRLGKGPHGQESPAGERRWRGGGQDGEPGGPEHGAAVGWAGLGLPGLEQRGGGCFPAWLPAPGVILSPGVRGPGQAQSQMLLVSQPQQHSLVLANPWIRAGCLQMPMPRLCHVCCWATSPWFSTASFLEGQCWVLEGHTGR